MVFDDDDEEELVPQTVSNYHFEDDDKAPVSFAVLPIQWSDKERVDRSPVDVFLRGSSDNGLQILYKPVKAWKFDLSNFKPEISALTKDNIWIKLQKPRKSFEGLIRTVLITLHSLHFLRRNSEASGKSLWEQLSKAFGSFDVKPSQNDLVDHIDLISEAVKRDDSLARSKFLHSFLEKKPVKKRLPDEDHSRDVVSNFIVEDDMTEDADEDDMDDDDQFESVCAICDNGGDILCCEGICLRSFHATKEDGEDSMCESLGLTKKEVDEIQKFFCKNCEYKMHQCFICGKLGSSDKSTGAKVFRCVSATCVYFYHPHCVARRLHIGNEAEAEALEKRIAAGESFTCPLHKCCICKQGEVKTDPKLQFAVCRRCPKSYHRKCLPWEIAFNDIEEEDIVTRAWDGLLPNRVLIYCLDHEIDEYLSTPLRDHVKFPFTEEKKRVASEQRKVLESLVGRDKMGSKVNRLVPRDASERKSNAKLSRNSIVASKDGASTKKLGVVSSVSVAMRKGKEVDPSKKSLLLQKRPRNMEVKEAHEGSQKKASLGMKLFNYMQDTETEKPGRVGPVDSNCNKTVSNVRKEPGSELLTLDTDSERRILALMEEATESITMEDILKKRKVLSTHKSSIKHIVDKTITLGKVEGSVEAVKTALAKLVEGNNIEDAKAVCEPGVLNQIFKWKDKLKVYLAPFLHGPRYTSFGRHFTKVDKLQEIVDRLHWYAQEGDMIVDFCCGANDFSWLMKEKLEETGKKCLYKNYDLLPAKNDFNFEKRDWMTVRKEELPPGSRLIMGLNPPFGVKASLANQFINKALEFQPKLLILIVPVETERLDKKKSPYVLVWEDKQFLSGKSFYLPGSVDNEDRQLDDWNLVSPPLSLWSRSDWAAKHMEIAQKHSHLSNNVGKSELEKDNHEANASGFSVGGCDSISVPEDSPLNNYGENAVLVNDDVPMELDEPEVADEVLLHEKGDNEILPHEKGEAQGTKARGNHQSNYLSRENEKEKGKMKSNNSRRMHEKQIESGNMLCKSNNKEEDRGESNREGQSTGAKMYERTSDRQSSVRSSVDDIYAVCLSPFNVTAGRSHEPMEASHGGTRKISNMEEDVRKTDRETKSIKEIPERKLNRKISARSSEDERQGAFPLPSDVTAPRSHDREITRTRSNMGEDVREIDGKAQSSRGMPERTLDRQISARSSRDDKHGASSSPSNVTAPRSHGSLEASHRVMARKRSNMGEDVSEIDGEAQSSRGIPEKTWNRQISVRFSRDDNHGASPSPSYATVPRSHGHHEITRNRGNMSEDVRELDGEAQSSRGMSEKTWNRQLSVRSSRDDKHGASPSPSNVTAPRSHDPLEASHRDITRNRRNIGEDVRGINGQAQSSRGMPDSTWNRQGSVRSSIDDLYSVHPSPSNAVQRSFDPFEASFGGSMPDLHDDVGRRFGYGGTYGVPDDTFMPEQFPLAPYMRDVPNEMIDCKSYTEAGGRIDVRDQIRRYGLHPDPPVSRDYLQGHSGHLDPISASAPYGGLVSATESSLYGMSNAPVTQRYPAHMDEFSCQRTNALLPQPPPQLDRNSFFDPRGPPLGPPGPPTDYRVDPTGFAPGPHHSYTFGHTSGWFND